MPRWQQAKILMRWGAYLATGFALMFGSILSLGVVASAFANLTVDGNVPLGISLMSLLCMFVGLGWGVFFIYKSLVPGAASRLVYHLIGMAGCKVCQLDQVSRRLRRGLASGIGLVAMGVLIGIVAPAMIHSFPDPPVMALVTSPAFWVTLVILFLSLAIGDYTAKSIKAK